MNLERNAMPVAGPQFTRDADGTVLFTHVIDSGNVIGPRPATKADQQKHAGTWAYFLKLEDASPLDRDARGGPGGSLPDEPRPEPPATTTARTDASDAQLRAIIKLKTGRAPHSATSREKLLEKALG